MLKLATLLLALLLASPAYAANELVGAPLSKIQELSKKHGVIIEKLNAADTAKVDAVSSERPKPSTIYLLTLGDTVILALVNEGKIIYSSDPKELKTINKVLERGGA